MNGALSHITVLDLSRVLAGPWAGQVLADLGARVIKVERPHSGDDTRGWGPPFLRDARGNDSADAAYYLCANRNKQSITVDITTPEGQCIVRDLARKSDVVIENFKVGGLAAYGLDYASLRAVHPAIIYCSITGFGQTGPYAQRAGYDLLVQAMGGLMSITGRRDDEPDLPHPIAGTVPLVANPLRLSATPVSYRSAPRPWAPRRRRCSPSFSPCRRPRSRSCARRELFS